jgi:hypothetical protein
LSSVASIVLIVLTLLAHAPVGPCSYFWIISTVHTTSSAVSGWPSDHIAFGVVWNVSCRPSFDRSQLWAKFGAKS